MAEAARWLAARETTLATHPAADEMHDEITHIAARVRTAIDRPPERRYLGAWDGDGADEFAGFP
ncbi:rhamnose utilization protein RhaD (predicted bifunctional aldolase and dehydrogenase) [Prauserella sediminis]|uniref:Rhamnose utilization protein RhaD (Predicted bifunctional aldolase and dehydrogenase) n=1 Tax=Prauserella sediminis TaxID=577680 RepID=A0A839XXH4_9PSEU|nr:hypothetical protein [Prauserella sediminis]MBB3664475.1 rhamnose utilization protein RhaD (predicted bifunctional aldolase and dehydrogenase) [Prauserella sediminis]